VGTVLAELDAAAAPRRPHPDESQPAADPRRRRRRRRIARGSTRRSCAGSPPSTVDLEQVAGKRHRGRVRKADLIAFLETR